MASDRFVRFDEVTPTQEMIQTVLEDFLGGVGKIEWKADRFFVDLPGKGSFVFCRVGKNPSGCHPAPREERWFEVWVGVTRIDVITREADEFTNALADRFARLCANYFKGTLEN